MVIVLAERLSLGALREQIEKTECLAEAARLRGEEALGLAGDALVALQNARLRNDEDKKEMLRLRKELNASHKRSQEIWAEYETKKAFEKSSEECESLRKDYYELYHRGMSERRSRESLMKELESLRAELEKKVAELFILDNGFPKDGTYEGEIDGKPAIVKISDSGNSNQMQVFYGGEGSPDGPGHNHVNIINGRLQFWREDGEEIYMDEKDGQFNNL